MAAGGDERVADASDGQAGQATVRVDAAPDEFDLGRLQFGMWLDEQYHGKLPIYSIPFAFRLNMPLDPERLEQAFSVVVNANDALRTVLVHSDTGPRQRVRPPLEVTLPFEDLTETDDPEAVLRARLDLRAKRCLDTGECLFETALYRVGSDEFVWYLNLHHLVADLWSVFLVCRMTLEVYDGGGDAVTGSRPFREHLASLAMQVSSPEDQAYWRAKFGSPVPALSLYGVHEPKKSTLNKRVSVTLESRRVAGLKRLAQREGIFTRNADISLANVLTGLLFAYLHKVSGNDDLAMGIPSHGRTVDFLETVGLFMHLLPIRVEIAEDDTVSSLIAKTSAELVSAHRHRHAAPGNTHQTQFYDVSFNFINSSLSPAHGRQKQASGLEDAPRPVAAEWLETGHRNFSLSVHARDYDRSGRLVLDFDFNADTFSDRQGELAIAHFLQLIDIACDTPDRRLCDICLLTPLEERLLLDEFNRTSRAYGEREPIHRLIEAQVRRSPEAVAVVFEERRLTYEELDRRAEALARELVALGAGPGSCVPFAMERGVELVVAMLGILKAGAAFVPLDVQWPAARRALAVRTTAAPVVVAAPSSRHAAESLGSPVVVVDASKPIQDLVGDTPERDVPLTSPMYVIFTSGSTGTAKGVVVPHQGILNRFVWMNEYFGVECAQVVLQTTSHVYDSAVWQLLWPLINGGRTVVPDSARILDATYLANLVNAEGVTMTDFVPSVFASLVPTLLESDERLRRLSSLRALVLGGEALRLDLAHRFMQRAPWVRVVNLYGPTEASIGCICYELTGREIGRVPIGRPIANVQALLLDRRGRPVPLGVAGELHLAGVCLALGYLGDEEKTNALFVPNSFPSIGGERLYKTGDLARYWPDGNLEFLGRSDQQVKIRGFRIELGEIEHVLAEHPAVQACAVLARDEESGNRRLVAYYVPAASEAPTSEVLRAFLTERLPEPMVPAVYVSLDALPLTPGGKLDRRALPAPATSDLRREGPASPRTALEETLVSYWQEALGFDGVGIHDDFFAIGGHSLMAVQLLTKVRQRLGYDLPLAVLFQAPTIAGLAERMEASQEERASILVEMRPGGPHQPFFCVHAAGGNLLCYYDLARLTPADHPFVGIQSIGVADDSAPLTRIEDMAATYLAAIRQVQPRGPYFIGGASMGGRIAFEMAHQLQAQGEELAVLAIIDMPLHEDHRETSAGWSAVQDVGFLRFFVSRQFESQVPRERLAAFKTAMDAALLTRPASTRILGVLQVLQAFDLLPTPFDYRIFAVVVHNYFASARHEPHPYRGPVTIFRTAALTDERLRPTLALVGAEHVHVVDVPGGHLDMLEPPHVATLGRELGTCLQRARLRYVSV